MVAGFFFFSGDAALGLLLFMVAAGRYCGVVAAKLL